MADTINSPAYLVAIARAARLAGDRLVESEARRRLRERWGIELTLRDRPQAEPREGGRHG